MWWFIGYFIIGIAFFSWFKDHIDGIIKWTFYIIFSPILLPIFLVGFIAGIILDIKDSKKSKPTTEE